MIVMNAVIFWDTDDNRNSSSPYAQQSTIGHCSEAVELSSQPSTIFSSIFISMESSDLCP
jgi:hypothetical protein